MTTVFTLRTLSNVSIRMFDCETQSLFEGFLLCELASKCHETRLRYGLFVPSHAYFLSSVGCWLALEMSHISLLWKISVSIFYLFIYFFLIIFSVYVFTFVFAVKLDCSLL